MSSRLEIFDLFVEVRNREDFFGCIERTLLARLVPLEDTANLRNWYSAPASLTYFLFRFSTFFTLVSTEFSSLGWRQALCECTFISVLETSIAGSIRGCENTLHRNVSLYERLNHLNLGKPSVGPGGKVRTGPSLETESVNR
jgi:hypothetical protein